MKPTLMYTALCAVAATTAPAQDEPRAAQKLDVKVLYAGQKDDPRTEDWRAFLTPRVQSFDAIQVDRLSTGTARDFDVVIVDGPTPYKPDGIKLAPGARLGADYEKPTILLGATGGATLSPLKIKLDWL